MIVLQRETLKELYIPLPSQMITQNVAKSLKSLINKIDISYVSKEKNYLEITVLRF